jgi:hypothetical protein
LTRSEPQSGKDAEHSGENQRIGERIKKEKGIFSLKKPLLFSDFLCVFAALRFKNKTPRFPLENRGVELAKLRLARIELATFCSGGRRSIH